MPGKHDTTNNSDPGSIAAEVERLDCKGFVVLPNLISDKFRVKLLSRVEELFQAEGDAAGSEFKQEPGCRRLANLIDKGDIFASVVENEHVLQLIESVLGPNFKLSSLNARSVNAMNNTVQPLHADMAAIADERGFWVCNSVWMLTDFTPDNGPTRIIPGSHRFNKLPQDALTDPPAPHQDEVNILGCAGTVAVMNAHAWHGGLANLTKQPRTALHAFYTRSDKPQQQFQKQLIRAEVRQRLSPQMRQLLALDDAENDRLSAAPAVRSGFLK